MVSSNKVEYYGLQLLVRPFPAKPESIDVDRYLFLTGESSEFELRIKNKTGRNIEGKLAVRFAYASGNGSEVLTNHFILMVNVEPYGEKISYMRESHQFEGQVVVSVCDIGQPEKYVVMDDTEVRDIAKFNTGEVLCTYKVLDKVIYELETKRFNDLAKNLKDSLTTHIDQTIQARLAEYGLIGTKKSLKSEVIEEQAKIPTQSDQKTQNDPSYIR